MLLTLHRQTKLWFVTGHDCCPASVGLLLLIYNQRSQVDRCGDPTLLRGAEAVYRRPLHSVPRVVDLPTGAFPTTLGSATAVPVLTPPKSIDGGLSRSLQ